MKIKNLSLNSPIIDKEGLKTFKSTKLNYVVALVGKNGSGKTRYLRAIRETLKDITIKDIYDGNIDFIPDRLMNSIASLAQFKPVFDVEDELLKIQLELSKDPQNHKLKQDFSKKNAEFLRLTRTPNYTQIKGEIDIVKKLISTEIENRIKVIDNNDLRALKESIENNKVSSFQDVIDSTKENLQVDEFSMIKNSALTFLRNLPHRLAHDELHTKGDIKKFKSRIAYKRYEILKNFISEFLDKELEWKSKTSQFEEIEDGVITKTSGYWTINQRPFEYNDFSDGEKVLFTYALLLFLISLNDKIKFNESIIFIDEPELNLHPKAQIKLVKKLENLIKDKGQLFIATHSLSIVSNLDYSSIHLVRENSLYSPASSVPFDSVDDLMGFDEHYNKLVEFLVSTPSWAMTNFMSECFDSPEVFEFAAKNDPQIETFLKLLDKGSHLNILDFGSGKGRLFERIKDSNSWSKVQKYDCFDVDNQYNELIKSKGVDKVFNTLDDIPVSNYDLVVVVNVLHEIHIDFWISSINKIKESLKPNGFIIIIEDVELPIGELPNEHGFILLGKQEMSTLLGGDVNFITPTDSRYINRIVCGFCQKENFASLNMEKLIETLTVLKANSLSEIENYRNINNKEAKLGRLYALKANLYVNCDLAIKKLTEAKKRKIN